MLKFFCQNGSSTDIYRLIMILIDNIIESSITMTSIKQSPAISPKNKDTVELVKQDKNQDHVFKTTLTSLNPHQEYGKKEKGAISSKLNQYYHHTIQKKHNIDEEDVKQISTTKEKEKEKEKPNDGENSIADNVAVFSEQLSFKQQHLNRHIVETAPLMHKFNTEIGNDKLPSNHVIDSNLTRTSNTGIISSFIANEKKNKLNPTEMVNEKKTDINALMTANEKNAVIDPSVMNKDKKPDDLFQYDDLNGVFQKTVQSELPLTIASNSKNRVVFNNTPLTEKEWGSELSRIIKNNIKDINQLEIIVHPRHLGPIKILIEEAKGKNKISIIAKDAYVATLIGEHVNNIQTKLLNSGESVSSIDVINDAKLNSADQENQHQHQDQRHNDQLDFGVIDNNVEIKKESVKISNGIFA